MVAMITASETLRTCRAGPPTLADWQAIGSPVPVCPDGTLDHVFAEKPSRMTAKRLRNTSSITRRL